MWCIAWKCEENQWHKAGEGRGKPIFWAEEDCQGFIDALAYLNDLYGVTCWAEEAQEGV
jgi:hypothetical protein